MRILKQEIHSLQSPLPVPCTFLNEVLGIAGLHCDAGGIVLPGCLNTDKSILADQNGTCSEIGRITVISHQPELFYLRHDATLPFPIEEEAFQWVYAEHFIEHLSLGDGVAWLKEMKRLLRHGGVIRLSTPDIAIYARAYLDEERRFFKAHVRRLDEIHFRGASARRAWMMNQIFRGWGHEWLYDFDELVFAASAAGFPRDAVRRCSFRQGQLADVAAFDLEVRNDESIYVEIVKP